MVNHINTWKINLSAPCGIYKSDMGYQSAQTENDTLAIKDNEAA
ncbi:conserved hypothetical protein [Desulfamplus magnetovallimortis]|uniref:Uncharacterized protein n=1 Tax=Desulfamplus magnetovallimortis TaxID=1246637 RepID=L0R4I1_9BACT|nr:conserved hypothetical protein [Desulfamplus magnetovallimortis BW-1]SLM32825.1 conserved hypothetical protein [Desulfamplus magnetovallimortis]